MNAWRIVPAEATCAMQAAWNAAEDGGWDAAHAAYLKAAPAPDYDALAVEVLNTKAAGDVYGDFSGQDGAAALAAALRGYFEGE